MITSTYFPIWNMYWYIIHSLYGICTGIIHSLYGVNDVPVHISYREWIQYIFPIWSEYVTSTSFTHIWNNDNWYHSLNIWICTSIIHSLYEIMIPVSYPYIGYVLVIIHSLYEICTGTYFIPIWNMYWYIFHIGSECNRYICPYMKYVPVHIQSLYEICTGIIHSL